jgi:tRNA modification GTPase
LGKLGEPAAGGLADDVIVAVQQVKPIPWVEVHCHGGPQVVQLLMDILEARGLQPCSWPDLERLTSPDPLAAEAAVALAGAPTIRTAAILLEQYHGALARALREIEATLLGPRPADAEPFLSELVRHGSVGRHLTEPWRVVVAGAPNVGKSTLVNALAGYQRSVVAATPGTTRDVVTTRIAIDGWPVELADTAGLRSEPEELERQGIDRAEAAAARADLCLWVLDSTGPPVWPDRPLPGLRYVVNKIDLPASDAFRGPEGTIGVSAKTGEGLDRLIQALAEWLVPHPPAAGAPVPFTPALCDQVEAALGHLTAGRFAEALQALPLGRTKQHANDTLIPNRPAQT